MGGRNAVDRPKGKHKVTLFFAGFLNPHYHTLLECDHLAFSCFTPLAPFRLIDDSCTSRGRKDQNFSALFSHAPAHPFDRQKHRNPLLVIGIFLPELRRQLPLLETCSH